MLSMSCNFVASKILIIILVCNAGSNKKAN
nr:MAG TPA: hypothetical protein [Caudoviricetes sp.]